MERRSGVWSFAISGQGTSLKDTYGRNTALNAMTSHLIAPHGGELVQLQVPAARAAELKAHSKDWPSWDLTARQLCDLELLMSGGFSPLRGFMNRADYEGVCHNMRLGNGTLWPMPITLDVTEEFAKKLTAGSSKIALRDPEGVMLAVLSVEDVWQPDRKAEAQAVFNSTSAAHPGAAYAINKSNPWYVGEAIKELQVVPLLHLHAAVGRDPVVGAAKQRQPGPPSARAAPAVGGQVVYGAAKVALGVPVDGAPAAQQPLQRGLQQVLARFFAAGEQDRRSQQMRATLGQELLEPGVAPVIRHRFPPSCHHQVRTAGKKR